MNVQTACAQLIRLGEEIVHSLNQANPKTDRVMLFQLSALRAIRLASACLLLDENGYVEEVLALTRTLSEVAINACYLQMAADQEAASFRVVDIQKSFRMSENLAKKMDATDIISDQERVKLQGIAAAARTKSQRKDNDMSWSTDHVAIRAEKLDKTMASGTEMFSLLKGSTYEFAHPFVHGSYQSFRAVRRLMSEGTFPADGDRETERIQALGVVNQCLFALCVYAHVKLGLPIEAEIREASRINLAPQPVHWPLLTFCRHGLSPSPPCPACQRGFSCSMVASSADDQSHDIFPLQLGEAGNLDELEDRTSCFSQSVVAILLALQ